MADAARPTYVDEAEARKFDAEAAYHAQKARGERISADIHEINLRAKQRDEQSELAKDVHHHVYVFDKKVEESSVKACIQQLTNWTRNNPGCDIEIQLNSPGGSIIDGFALIDFIRDLQQRGHKITTVALGMAASMAGVILQVGDKRVIGENAVLLIHEGSFGAVGDYGEVKDRVELMELLHDRILSLYAARSKMSKAAIKRKWTRKDWWLLSSEALKHGFVDEVK